jgi:hypothetical protein
MNCYILPSNRQQATLIVMKTENHTLVCLVFLGWKKVRVSRCRWNRDKKKCGVLLTSRAVQQSIQVVFTRAAILSGILSSLKEHNDE